MHRSRTLLLTSLALFASLLASCAENDADRVDPTATPRAIPSPVDFRPDPQGITLADPAFDALDGAQAYFGNNGGSAFRIEIPDAWNGTLVLYMHGFQGLAPQASVQDPGIRSWLIRNGYAWGAASYSSTALIPGRAADETAALWDLFVREHGQPKRTYVTGHSMGGGATAISAERYGDRYDGALGLCGMSGQSAQSQIVGDYFYTAAYVAGITQAEFDAAPIDRLTYERIVPALRDPAKHEQWEALLFDMTGGRRPFDNAGFAAEESTNWLRSNILVPFGLAYNDERVYGFPTHPASLTTEFNSNVIRTKPNLDNLPNFIEGNETTGELQIPLLTLHTTGDWQVPIDQQQILRRSVDAAGKGDLLVQRAIQDAGHCGFTDAEWIDGLLDLIAWVERGETPEGEDLLVSDLSDIGARFTLAPRLGSKAADTVTGAAGRTMLSGDITLDGAPLPDGANIWAEVWDGGMRALCSYPTSPSSLGRYTVTIAGDAEVTGCGGAGRQIVVVAGNGEGLHFSRPVPWPGAGEHEVAVALDAQAADIGMRSTPLFGSATDASGASLPPGTRIDAYAGTVRCGSTSVPRAVMVFSNPDSYLLMTSSPDAVPGCAEGAPLTLRIDGVAVGTATNTLDYDGQQTDAVLPPD